MKRVFFYRTIGIWVLVNCLWGGIYVSAQSPKDSPEDPHLSSKEPPKTIHEENKKSFLTWINSEAYANQMSTQRNEGNEKKRLRKRWKELLGIDIFMPYFKAKEMERWVREKTSVHLFKLKGSPQFKDNQVKYIFKIRF